MSAEQDLLNLVDDLEAQILEAAGDLQEDINGDLVQLAADIQNMLRRGNFTNRTGRLRGSMYAVVQDNMLTINMLDYGYFISFGVKGREKGRRTRGLTEEVANAFGVKAGYNFGPSNFGIDGRNFYPTNLDSRLEGILAAAATKLLQ